MLKYPPRIMITQQPIPPPPSPEERQQARTHAVEWSRMIMSDPGAVFLDTETTGLDNSAEIIEISVVDCSGNALLDTLVRPFSPIPPDAIAVHGISGEMVQDAPAWGDVFPELARLVQHRRVVVYNAPFDYRMVQQMNSRCGITSDLRDWECAMQQYSRYTGVWHERYGNYRWHRLTDALAQFGHYQAGHRAMVDAQACRLVVDGMARSGS